MPQNETTSTAPVNMESAPLVRSSNVTSIFLNRMAKPRAPAAVPTLGGFMSEPASTAAGGIAAWKLAGGILGIGVVASALGFLVLLPKTPREAALRALATMAGSALVGPFFVAAAFTRWPELFASGVKLATMAGLEPWFGLFGIAAPLLALAGLPFWWLLGAAVLWLENRKGKDLGQLAADARADVVKAVAP